MTMRSGRIVSITISLIFMLLGFAGCAQRMQSVKDDKAGANASAILQGIQVSPDASQIAISADKPMVYTFYTLTAPPKAVIDLAQTEPGTVAPSIDVAKGGVKKIEVARHGFGESVLSRVEISLENDQPFTVNVDPADRRKLLVGFAKPSREEKGTGDAIEEQQVKVEDLKPAPVASAETKPVAAASEKAASLRSVTKETAAKMPEHRESVASDTKGKVLTAVKSVREGIDVSVTGGVSTFNAFKLADPFRLVLDLPDVKNGVSSKTIAIDTFGISKARVGTSPGKTRIVFDAAKNTIPPYQILKNDKGVEIRFNKTASAAAPLPVAEGAVSQPVKQRLPEVAPEPVKQSPAEPAATKAPPAAAKAPPATVKAPPAAAKAQPSVVEAIDFQPMGEYSRISIKMTGECTAEKPRQVPTGWALTIKHCQLPRKLQRMLDTGAFASSVREITPYQVKVGDGYDAKILVKLRSDAPFNFRQEGRVVYWDIKNPVAAEAAASPVEAARAPAVPSPAVAKKEKPASAADKDVAVEKAQATRPPVGTAKIYTGRRVTLEFSDADVRKIFQLIAEVSNLNFLIADDVTGTISLKLVNVPWDQALDVILDSKGLEKRQEGNILYIKRKGMFRTFEQEEAAAREEREKRMEPKTRLFEVNFAAVADIVTQFAQFKSKNPRAAIAADIRTNRVIATDIEENLDKMANLLKQLDIPEKQVMIEARIVEASSSFSRDLGVQWGLHYQDGSASLLGINNLDAGFGGVVNTIAPTTGTSGPGTAIGMSFGKLTSNIQLDLRLAAAATAGQVKIISTPKVVTLNNKAAKISQGQSIPYQTTSAEGTKTEFVQAALSLDVTPHVTADGNIGLKIKATNNSAGSAPAGSPPPINTKEATTELQVMDGETTVIGGIYVDTDTESNSGVPFLMDIPLLGWAFKSNVKNKTKSELLIFITPRIVH